DRINTPASVVRLASPALLRACWCFPRCAQGGNRLSNPFAIRDSRIDAVVVELSKDSFVELRVFPREYANRKRVLQDVNENKSGRKQDLTSLSLYPYDFTRRHNPSQSWTC